MKSRHDYYDQLGDVALFSGLGRAALRVVGSLTTGVDGAAGTVWTTEGKPGLEAFVVVDGEASVSVDGREVAVLGPGAVFGEMAVLDRMPRTATVTALTPMRVLVMGTSEFRSLLDRVPEVEDRVRSAMAYRAEQAAETTSP